MRGVDLIAEMAVRLTAASSYLTNRKKDRCCFNITGLFLVYYRFVINEETAEISANKTPAMGQTIQVLPQSFVMKLQVR